MAPHGGIFVVAVIGNPLYYLLALAIGTIIGALILGILKENVKDPQLGKFKGLLNKEN
jgi:PTS system fructose-specific IIC component